MGDRVQTGPSRPQASSNRESLEECPKNSYSIGASNDCTECANGGHSRPGSSACETCSTGKYYNEVEIRCDQCPKNTFTILALLISRAASLVKTLVNTPPSALATA